MVVSFLLLNGCTAWKSMTGFISLDSCLEETAGNLKLQWLCAAITSGPARAGKAESDQHCDKALPAECLQASQGQSSFCSGSQDFR